MSVVINKNPVKKSSKHKADLKKALEKQDEFLDNILEQESQVDDLLELPDIMEEETEKGVTLIDIDPDNLSVKQSDIINLIPYFNDVEQSLYLDILSEGSSVEYDIQYCIRFILKTLKTYETNMDRVNRDIVETKILALLDSLSIALEPFWQELSCNKDIVSYKLNGRCFPTFKLVEEETTEEVDPQAVKSAASDSKKTKDTSDPKEEAKEKRDEKREEIAKKYDLGKPSLKKTLNASFAGSSSCLNANV